MVDKGFDLEHRMVDPGSVVLQLSITGTPSGCSILSLNFCGDYFAHLLCM